MAMWVGLFIQTGHDVRRGIFLMALHAMRGADSAVQVHDDVVAVAGLLMQRIEVLRGQQRQHAGLFQLDQRLMRSAGLRIPYWRFLLPAPGVLAVLFVAQEQIDVVNAHLVRMLGPHTVRTAEIRDAGGRGNARPG